MVNLLRAFIAIEIPPEIKQAISTHTAGLQKETFTAVRWVAPNNVHLTLKFLGDVSSASLEKLSQAIKAECALVSPFVMTAAGAGCFPNLRHPRTAWVGLTAPPELNRLQRRIEALTIRLGYPPEDKHFSPHLTIGRVREQATGHELQILKDFLKSAAPIKFGEFDVKTVTLFKSDLQPGGPQYTPISIIPLG